MKRLKATLKLCPALICSLGLVLNTAMAADPGAKVVYNSVSGKLEISGTGNENSQITAMVMPYTTDSSQITADTVNEGNVVFDIATIDYDGNYTLKMGLRDTWNGGLYKVVIDETEFLFTYADSKKLAGNLASINSGDDKDIAAILKSKRAELGADSEHAEKYSDDLGKYLYANRPTGGYSADEFLKAYTAGLAICMIRSGEYTIDKAVSKLGGYMEIESDGTEYSDQIISDAERIMGQLDITSGSAKDIYSEAMVVAQLNAAETPASVQQTALKNKDILDLDFTDYNKLSNDYKKLQVFGKLLDIEFDNAKEFAEEFKKASENVLENSEGPSYVGGGNGGSSSGGGSGGGKGSGGFGGGGAIISNTPEAQIPDGSFSDMENHWGNSAVKTLTSLGIVGGYPNGTFQPENNVTRAEYAKMLALALNIPAADYKVEYQDIAKDDWYAPYVLALSDRGIITGWMGRFDPNGKITRQDAAVMTYRAVKDMLTSSGTEVTFEDSTNIADYAKEAVGKLSSLKIINGYNGMFEPTNNTTRAQAATIICNVLTVCGIK